MFKEFDKIRLKTGETAHIVEIFSDKDFLADVRRADDEYETVDIKLSDIATRFVEYEVPVSAQISA